MFSDHNFTTIFFLDYGKDGQDNTFDDYVYAYGMDYNWRDSFSDVVRDPVKLYLARMPKDGLQDLNTWQFYTGDLEGNESWSRPGDIAARKAVLEDSRRRYQRTITSVNPNNLSVISQGSVVYNKPLDRYIYTSWTEFTFEFYEAPTPWGPWNLFLSKDFGAYPWNNANAGGYATVIPSKFINQLVYTTGEVDASKGGWFKNIRVQVRQNFKWIDVENLQIEPSYTFDNKVESYSSYKFTFDENHGDGIRIIGQLGGILHYTSISELEVYYAAL